MPKATAISGSQEMFRATGCKLPLWSAGQLWAKSQAGQQNVPSCPCSSAGGFQSSSGTSSRLWKSFLNSALSQVRVDVDSTHRRIPIREALKLAKISFCSHLRRWHNATEEEEEVIRHCFPRTKREENMRIFSHLFFFFLVGGSGRTT